MATSSPDPDDVLSLLDACVASLRADVRTRGLRTDADVLRFLRGHPEVREGALMCFRPEQLRQKKDLALAKQLLVQGGVGWGGVGGGGVGWGGVQAGEELDGRGVG